MTDSEKLDLLLAGMQDMKSDLLLLKTKVTDLEKNVTNLDNKVTDLDQKFTGLEENILELHRRVIDFELHMENVTDKNISLLAENFIDLTNKLNQAIPAADKNLAYEVKVNYLIEEVEELKTKVENLILKTAG
ncbi:MAG: hypothetical protein K2P27_01235 [Lachnospiraceae bacterium]|nr:hypothetical protein [Lachnospiraceae bacterium]